MSSFAHQEISSSRSLYNLYRPSKRNLGCAILAAAITDYQGMDDQAHASAKQFLYPATPEYQKHYDWAVAMANGVNQKWLREALDGAQKFWDCERLRNSMRRNPRPVSAQFRALESA